MHQSMCRACHGTCSHSRPTVVRGRGSFGGRADPFGAELAGPSPLVACSSKGQGPPGLKTHGFLAVHLGDHPCTDRPRRVDDGASMAGHGSAPDGGDGSLLQVAGQRGRPWWKRRSAVGAGRPSFGMGTGLDHPSQRSLWPTVVFGGLRGDVACCAMAVASPSGNRNLSRCCHGIGGESFSCGLFQRAGPHLVDAWFRQDQGPALGRVFAPSP